MLEDIIIDALTEYFGIELDAMIEKNKTEKITEARNYMYLFLHYYAFLSCSTIAKMFNRSTREIQRRISNTKFQTENVTESKKKRLEIEKLIKKKKKSK